MHRSGFITTFLLATLLTIPGCTTLDSSVDDWFGKDKLYHFGVSSLISGAITKNDIESGRDKSNAVNTGVFITMGLGSGKEFRDKYIKNNFWSWKDMIWNFAGAYLGSELAND